MKHFSFKITFKRNNIMVQQSIMVFKSSDFQSDIIINQFIVQKSTSMNSFLLEDKETKIHNLPMLEEPGPFKISRKQMNLNLTKYIISWTQTQELRFAAYLHKNEERMRTMGKIEKWEIFKTISKFVKSKNLSQCKNFYMKIILKYNKIPLYIQSLQEKIQSFSQKFQVEIKNLNNFSLWLNSNSRNSISKTQSDSLKTDIAYSKQPRFIQICQNRKIRKCSLPKSALKIFYPSLTMQSQNQAPNVSQSQKSIINLCGKFTSLFQID